MKNLNFNHLLMVLIVSTSSISASSGVEQTNSVENLNQDKAQFMAQMDLAMSKFNAMKREERAKYRSEKPYSIEMDNKKMQVGKINFNSKNSKKSVPNKNLPKSSALVESSTVLSVDETPNAS
ncbi:hypothetical protein [Candidatus Chromulinivorax destructor]|uniref:Uncharacterized protein n=1 Tax=Candidatus Chromulinivorax destructor TaxID=2066483 RepID=A0A345ZCI1_9BACT|nr:hypothetical protein [Candidatus Chromulinivorax destructor]AXK60998.1 hypothetical protein C0J27_04675 [Candidatus Chromulinivorax destructor]